MHPEKYQYGINNLTDKGVGYSHQRKLDKLPEALFCPLFSVTGNKNRKIWQEMEVGCGENAACGGASGTPPPYRGRL